MYNEPVKQAFIRKYTASGQTKKLLLHIFSRTQEIEERYHTDFYAMNVKQAQEAFNCASGVQTNGASAILLILKAYVRWCTANGYQTSDAVYDLRFDVYDKVRSGYVSSPRHLKDTLDEVFKNPDQNEIEYIYRSYFWLGFMGLKVQEAIQVTADVLDFTNMHLTFFHDGTTRLIYPESLQDLRKAVELKELREPRGKEGVKKPRADGREILRGKVSRLTMEESIELTFRPTISRAFKAAMKSVSIAQEGGGREVSKSFSSKLTFKHAYMSGIFYRAYEKERMGIPPDFDEIVLAERRNSKEVSSSQNYTERKLLNGIIRGMEQDYDNWKSVFG